jgi:hypothetical protein
LAACSAGREPPRRFGNSLALLLPPQARPCLPRSACRLGGHRLPGGSGGQEINTGKAGISDRIRKPQCQQYLKNAYRFLLTRARQRMVIVVPEGDPGDPTRKAEFLRFHVCLFAGDWAARAVSEVDRLTTAQPMDPFGQLRQREKVGGGAENGSRPLCALNDSRVLIRDFFAERKNVPMKCKGFSAVGCGDGNRGSRQSRLYRLTVVGAKILR